MPSSQSYGIVTPSFRLDLDRCELLIESIEQWVAPHVKHYLVVDRRDVPLFASIATPRTTLLVVEDIVPNWLVRIPGVRRFWLSLRTRPVKNWVLQQIVKLSVPSVVDADVLLYTDSDVFFINPYDPRSFERDGKVPLFMEDGQRGLIPNNDEWHAVASRLLGLPIANEYDTNFISNVICWRRENALALERRIEEIADARWQTVLASMSAFSEYIVYGVFSSQVLGLGEASGHWQDDVVRTLGYWDTVKLDIAGLQELKAQQEPHHHTVMISAKSHTSVPDIRQVFCPG
jgi:hypothetical protein